MKRLVGVLAASLVLALLGQAAAQGRAVRLDGWVQWVAGDRMMLVLDGGPSVGVELTRVPQNQYMGLRQRDQVTVFGVASSDNRRVFATHINHVGSAEQSP